MSRSQLWRGVAPVSGLAALAAVTLDLGAPLQPVLVGWFLLACPGMAIVRLIGMGSRLLSSATAVMLSIALGVAVSLALLYSGQWSPVAGLTSLVLLTLLAAAAEAVREATSLGRRSAEPDAGG